MNPYTPPNEPPKSGYSSTRRRSPRGNRRQPDPADAIGAVLVAILVFVVIVVGILLRK